MPIMAATIEIVNIVNRWWDLVYMDLLNLFSMIEWIKRDS